MAYYFTLWRYSQQEHGSIILPFSYSNIRQQNYTVIYPNQNVLPSLKTRIETTMEYARLYYQVNERVSPLSLAD
jgi:hypothetical protein